jgi:hypothetical protein
MEIVEWKEWGEYPRFAQDADDWVAPRFLANGQVEISEETGSLTASLPDELLVAILAMTGDSSNYFDIPSVCRRWNRLTKDGEFLPIFYPIFSGLAKGLLSQYNLYSNLNASIRALDCGDLQQKRIGGEAGLIGDWTYVATKDHLLFAIAGTNGIGVWTEEGEALVTLPGVGRSVQFVNYLNQMCLLCELTGRIELRRLDSSEPICTVNNVRNQLWKTAALYPSIKGNPYVAWSENSSLWLYNLTSRQSIDTGVSLICKQVVSCQGSTYLIGWGAEQNGYTYLRLEEEPYQPISVAELSGWRTDQNNRILKQINFEETIYSPVWTCRTQKELASLRLVSFDDTITVTSPFLLSKDEPVLQARIEEVEGVRYLLAITEKDVIRWVWDKPNAPMERARLRPHYNAVSKQTDLNGWGAFATEVWQDGKLIKTHYQLPSGEAFEGHLSSGLLYVDAGTKGRRALWFHEETYSCYDPSSQAEGEIVGLEQPVQARQIIFQERPLFLAWNYDEGKLALFQPPLVNEGGREVQQKKQERMLRGFWAHHDGRIKMTAAALVGALYLGWMVQQTIGRAQLGNLWGNGQWS